MKLRKVNIRQSSDYCLIVLIFGVVAHYACIHLQNLKLANCVQQLAGCTPVNMDDYFRPGTNGLSMHSF